MNRWTALAATLALAACTATETPPEDMDAAAVATGDVMMTTPPSTSEGTRTATSGEPTRSTPAIAPDAELDSCDASRVRARWTGVLPTDEVRAEIAKAVGERRIRYYTEGDPITMDYSEDRLNVVLGKDGRIAEFRCG